MSRAELSLQLSASAGPGDLRYWIALEQIKEPELATFEETAEVLDEAFDLDPCIPDDEAEEVLEPEDEPSRAEKIEEAKEKYLEIVERLAGESDICKEEEEGFSAKVKLTRSHQSLSYTLLPQNCTVIRTIVGNTDSVNRAVAVKNSSRLDEKLPADQAISASWEGAVFGGNGRLDTGPEIQVSEGRVWWQGQVTGAIRLSYNQSYDILEIETADEDAALTALYRLSVDRIDIEPPPEDDQVEELCKSVGGGGISGDRTDNITCFETVTTHYKCDCSGKTVDTKEYDVVVPCPSYVKKCPAPGSLFSDSVYEGDHLRCSRFLGSRSENKYVDCRETDDVNDPEYYEQKCCDPPTFPLPECREKYRTYNGKGLDPELVKQIKRTYGKNTNIVLVGPDPPPCGTLTYEQDVNQLNCCDGVEPLTWDSEISVEVIDDHAVGVVGVIGGIAPFSVKVRGQGFYLDRNLTQRDGVTNSRAFRIYTGDACGPCYITVTDGCSTVSNAVRSSNGRWELVPELTYRCDDFTNQAKDRILKSDTAQGDERVVEYWGRNSSGYGCTQYSWFGPGGEKCPLWHLSYYDAPYMDNTCESAYDSGCYCWWLMNIYTYKWVC